jgi:hypothetical protein
MQALWTGGLLELLSVTVLATIASGANIVPPGDLKAAEGTPFGKAHKQLSKILAAAEAMLRMLATFAAKGLMKAESSLSAVTITTQICSIGGGMSQLGALVRQSAISSEEVCQFDSLLSTLGRCATAERGWQEQKTACCFAAAEAGVQLLYQAVGSGCSAGMADSSSSSSSASTLSPPPPAPPPPAAAAAATAEGQSKGR